MFVVYHMTINIETQQSVFPIDDYWVVAKILSSILFLDVEKIWKICFNWKYEMGDKNESPSENQFESDTPISVYTLFFTFATKYEIFVMVVGYICI